jgi:hypothetical protein
MAPLSPSQLRKAVSSLRAVVDEDDGTVLEVFEVLARRWGVQEAEVDTEFRRVRECLNSEWVAPSSWFMRILHERARRCHEP